MVKSISSIIVLINPISDANLVLAWADQLAEAFSAVIDVGYLREDYSSYIGIAGLGGAMSEATIQELSEAAKEAETIARAKFQGVKDAAPHGRFRELQTVISGYDRAVARMARTADLLVMQAPGRDAWSHQRRAYLGLAAIDGGASVFAAPGDSEATASLANVAIGWDGSREAAAALRASIPFLQNADTITLIVLSERKAAESLVLQAQKYLATHQLTARVQMGGSATGREGPRLLDAAARTGAVMLVMGAYGRSKWMEGVLGGATEHCIHHASVPLLLSH